MEVIMDGVQLYKYENPSPGTFTDAHVKFYNSDYSDTYELADAKIRYLKIKTFNF